MRSCIAARWLCRGLSPSCAPPPHVKLPLLRGGGSRCRADAPRGRQTLVPTRWHRAGGAARACGRAAAHVVDADQRTSGHVAVSVVWQPVGRQVEAKVSVLVVSAGVRDAAKLGDRRVGKEARPLSEDSFGCARPARTRARRMRGSIEGHSRVPLDTLSPRRPKPTTP